MRIWIDVLTPKQLLFTRSLAKRLQERGHELLLTARHYHELSFLAKRLPMAANFVGRHGGGSLLGKLTASAERITMLGKLVDEWRPELAVSFMSPDGARVAFGLGLRHLCITDSPHAEHVARLSLPLSDFLMTPWIIPYAAWERFGVKRGIIESYRALDPFVWVRDVSLAPKAGAAGMTTIVIRTPEAQASYLLGVDSSNMVAMVERVVAEFSDANIVLLTRYQGEDSFWRDRLGDKVIIPSEGFDGIAILTEADIFLGGGGTMTQEAALLGAPTVSAYYGPELYTERYLLKKGLIIKPRTVDGIIQEMKGILQDRQARRRWLSMAKRLRDELEDPLPKIVSRIEHLAPK